jgi:hypothetical protein
VAAISPTMAVRRLLHVVFVGQQPKTLQQPIQKQLMGLEKVLLQVALQDCYQVQSIM